MPGRLRFARRHASKAPYAPDVRFDDGARAFEGVEGFETHTFIKDVVGNAARRRRGWRWRTAKPASSSGAWSETRRGSVDVFVTTTLTMNPITGRVVKQEEQWDFSRCGGSAGTFLPRAAAARRKTSPAPWPTPRNFLQLIDEMVDFGRSEEAGPERPDEVLHRVEQTGGRLPYLRAVRRGVVAGVRGTQSHADAPLIVPMVFGKMASVFYRRLRTEPRENIRARFGGDAKRALDMTSRVFSTTASNPATCYRSGEHSIYY